MNQQTVHPQMATQGNQQQPQPQQQVEQTDPTFQNGARLFQRLQQNLKQEFCQFKRLKQQVMLQYWINMGGPQDQEAMDRGQLYLSDLKEYQSEAALRRKLPRFFIDLKHWLHSLGHLESAEYDEIKTLKSQ